MRHVKTLAVATLLAAPVSAFAAINYGDLPGSNVVYTQVQEDSTTDPAPLYGTPTVYADAITFNPVTFGASAANGSIDLTDGTLTMGVSANSGKAIHVLSFAEAGDYTLGGNGTSATNVSVNAPYFLRVVEVDGVSVTPVEINGNFTFAPANTFSLPADAGVGVLWSGGVSVDVDALLAANNVSGQATKITFSLDNSLLAQSETGTVAFIKKKSVDGLTVTVITPEPATLSAFVAGLTLLGRRRRA